MSHFHLYEESTIPNGLIEKFRETFPVKTMDMLSKEFDQMYSQMVMRQNGKFMMTLQLQRQQCLSNAIREILNVKRDTVPFALHVKPYVNPYEGNYWTGADVQSGLPWYPQMKPVNRIMDLGTDLFVRRMMPHDAVPAHDVERVDELWRKHIYSQMAVSPELLKREVFNDWPVTNDRSKELRRLQPEREDADDVYPRKYRTHPAR